MTVTCVSYLAEGWGVGELWLEGTRLVWHELPGPRPHPHPDKGWGSNPPPSRSTIPRKRARVGAESVPIAQELVHRVQAYLAGERVSFDAVELELDGWTPFQLDVLRTLRRVSYGEVISYSELARASGHANAQRAVGTFCAGNRFALVVPCHRVVAANGIGAYGSLGPEYKRRLLELEGATL